MELDFAPESPKSSIQREHVFKAVERVLDEVENQQRNVIDELDDGAQFRTEVVEILERG